VHPAKCAKVGESPHGGEQSAWGLRANGAAADSSGRGLSHRAWQVNGRLGYPELRYHVLRRHRKGLNRGGCPKTVLSGVLKAQVAVKLQRRVATAYCLATWGNFIIGSRLYKGTESSLFVTGIYTLRTATRR
jgi:hypothetical protein